MQNRISEIEHGHENKKPVTIPVKTPKLKVESKKTSVPIETVKKPEQVPELQKINSTPVPLRECNLNRSLLKHQVETDIYSEEILLIQEEKDKIQAVLQQARQTEEQRKLERQNLENELLEIQRSQIIHFQETAKEASELENLRQQREEMLQQRESQLLQQKEIEGQIEVLKRENEQLEALKQEQNRLEILRQEKEQLEMDRFECQTYGEIKQTDFKHSESSIISYDKSMSDVYSSFINDIRTVYELQDEENMSQAEMETVIKRPSPLPELDESEITLLNNYIDDTPNQSFVEKEIDYKDDPHETSREYKNTCPAFPAISGGKKQSFDREKFSESEMSPSYKNYLRLGSLKSFHKAACSQGGRSFGSKVVSRRVSPKTNNIPHTNSDSEVSKSDDSSTCEKRVNPRDIRIENLNTFSDKSERSRDKYSDHTKHLHTMSSNFDMNNINPIVLLNTSPCHDYDEEEEGYIETAMLPEIKLSDHNVFKRNSTVKELRKQQLIETQPNTAPVQSVLGANRNLRRKNRTKAKRRRVNKKRLRDLSQGNQVVYKGTRGYELVKMHLKKRRNESCQFRQMSAGSNGVLGSVRSRNKSSEWFSSVRSCSSGCDSERVCREEGSRLRSQPGFFTRNKLNAKYRAITEAKRQRMQNTLSKVMKIHANHAEPSDLSRKSSHAPCSSVNQSTMNKGACKCELAGCGMQSNPRSSERKFDFGTPKISVCDQDFVQLSRNYEANRKYYNFSNDNSQIDFLKIDDIKNYAFNSHGKISPKSISQASNHKDGFRTQKPSFCDSKTELNVFNTKNMGMCKQISDCKPLHPVMETEVIDSDTKPIEMCQNRKNKSSKTTAHHTASTSVGQENKFFFESADLYTPTEH